MAKTLAGVLAVSIAALLFAGCGRSGLSPAQKERCEEIKLFLAKDKQTKESAKAQGSSIRSNPEYAKLLEERKKEYAALGC